MISCKYLSHFQEEWQVTCVQLSPGFLDLCTLQVTRQRSWLILSDRQHAFRKGNSYETQLTTVINDWAKILNNRGQVDTVILDFEKAFDTPHHELLKTSRQIVKLWNRWQDIEMDRFLSMFQTTTSCCKWRKIQLGPSFVGCPPGHRSWSLVVLSVHIWYHVRYWVWNKTFCWWLCLLSWN